MQGEPTVLEMLNRRLAAELSAMDIYLLQGRMLQDWGYRKLSERLVHESEDERHHADRLIQRILFLGGVPDVTQRIPVSVGANVLEMLQNDLRYELDVARGLNEGMALCERVGDNGSRALLEALLKETEEDHIRWLEAQLFLVDSLGVQLYLSEQL